MAAGLLQFRAPPPGAATMWLLRFKGGFKFLQLSIKLDQNKLLILQPRPFCSNQTHNYFGLYLHPPLQHLYKQLDLTTNLFIFFKKNVSDQVKLVLLVPNTSILSPNRDRSHKTSALLLIIK